MKKTIGFIAVAVFLLPLAMLAVSCEADEPPEAPAGTAEAEGEPKELEGGAPRSVFASSRRVTS